MMARVGLAVAGVVLVVFVLYAADEGMTGLATAQVAQKLVNSVIDQSQRFSLRWADEREVHSFSVVGEAIGSGAVVMVLDNGMGGKRVVFSNVQNVTKAWFVSGEETALDVHAERVLAGHPAGDAEGQGGRFAACGDACVLDPAWHQEEMWLDVYVAPGTRVVLEKVVFS